MSLLENDQSNHCRDVLFVVITRRLDCFVGNVLQLVFEKITWCLG